MSSEMQEAMEELSIPETATSKEKLDAVCQWVLGDREWASSILEWVREAGYKVEDGTE